jgi:hypothetical protein
MDELLARLADVAHLERIGTLLAWDQEVCMPPADAAAPAARLEARQR